MKVESAASLKALYEAMGIPESPAGDRFRTLGSIESYAKGEQLPLYRNDRPFLYLLLEGCTCCEAATPDGRGILECIAYKPHSAVNPVGMFTESWKGERCVCLTDSDFAVFPLEAVTALMQSDIGLMGIYSACLRQALDEQVRHKYVLTLHAEERYRWFMETYGTVAEQIPGKTVAQFLTIDPATLSRIRGKRREEREEARQ